MSQFDKYLKKNNSEEKKYCLYWLTSFGIQSVVNLKPSEFLLDLIVRHIEGEIDLKRVQTSINEHYHRLRKEEDQKGHHTFEADKVSARIVELFFNPHFNLSLDGFKETHRHMFHGIYAHSGELRQHPASKKEWVLGNSSVLYPKAEEIEEHMNYLFETERNFDYSHLSRKHKLRHFCDFISKLFIYNTFQYANSRVAFVCNICSQKVMSFPTTPSSVRHGISETPSSGPATPICTKASIPPRSIWRCSWIICSSTQTMSCATIAWSSKVNDLES